MNNKPEWANWKAMDKDSCWHRYQDKPYTGCTYWYVMSGRYELILDHPTPSHLDWKDTLTYIGEDKVMNLEAGMRIVFRNGKSGLIVDDGDGDLVVLIQGQCESGYFTHYWNYDLTNSDDEKHDIVKVYITKGFLANNVINLSYNMSGYEPTWEREEVEVMTIEAAEKLLGLLGHKVKVVK